MTKMKKRLDFDLNSNDIIDLISMCCHAGNGQILDDIVQHSAHDLFWCFHYERKDSSYVNIKTNKKDNELTYSMYHARMSSTTLYKKLEMDVDSLFPPRHELHTLH
jgi:hypothetical protein